MNPNLCFEYRELMLRYNEKNKPVKENNAEMRSKNMKQRNLEHRQDHHK